MKANAVESPTPFVYWGQSDESVFLKVALSDAKDTSGIELTENELKFKATGNATAGERVYEFKLTFYAEIDTLKSKVLVVDSAVKFTLVKAVPKGWPRLTKDSLKMPWLRVDFDHLYTYGDDSDSSWTDEEQQNSRLPPKSRDAKAKPKRGKLDLEDDDDDDDGDSKDSAQRRMLREQMKRLKEEIDVLEHSWPRYAYLIYMLVYHIFILVGSSFCLLLLGLHYARDGSESLKHAYEHVGSQMLLCVSVQLLDVLHVVLGWTQVTVKWPLYTQAFARWLLVALLFTAPGNVQMDVSVCWLFVAWCVDNIRYVDYLLVACDQRRFAFLTWLHYTVWVFAWPTEFISGGLLILKTILLLDIHNTKVLALRANHSASVVSGSESEASNWTIVNSPLNGSMFYSDNETVLRLDLPNALNFSFDMAHYLKFYLFAYAIAHYYLMMFMYRLRKRKVGSGASRSVFSSGRAALPSKQKTR